MKYIARFTSGFAIMLLSAAFFSSAGLHSETVPKFSFPYKKSGLTERQAAAHLLSRFTFGARPGEIDEVVNMGLEKWFQRQLEANIPDDSLNQLLIDYDALKMSNTEVVNNFPKPGQILKMAVKEGLIDKDSVKVDKKEYRDQLGAYMKQKGLRPEQELLRQFINQKILRAAKSENQLQEVLTDFWFNHFNVSITKNDCAQFIPAYERDVIRPNALGKFETLLMATAKSPAMLYYLDNFSSSGTNTDGMPDRGANFIQRRGALRPREQEDDMQKQQALQKLQQAKKAQGLNENYAREVMELHTLGVDGGYTQQDVTQAAKVLTGWTVFPMDENGPGAGAIRKLIDKVGEDKLEERGFVHDGDFLFAVNRHDNSEKTVLGKTFPSHGGYEEGVALLHMLAHHSSTAHFICRKIAVRFVSDNPSQSLIDKMAKTFLDKDGDIKQVLITMATSPEFWSADAVREKTKSPFELAISTVRGLDAQIKMPYLLYQWITKMGQQIYYYQAPTGFPDKAQYWINTGALLNRMNFGLAFASGRIPGVSFDLVALNNHHEPESAEAALTTYSKLMMPERDLNETIKRLTPLLNDPNLVKKVDDAASKTVSADNNDMYNNTGDMMMADRENKGGQNVGFKGGVKGLAKNNDAAIQRMQSAPGNNSMLSQVVGIIIGSPEFQRK